MSVLSVGQSAGQADPDGSTDALSIIPCRRSCNKTTSERIIAMDVLVTKRDGRTFILYHSVSYGFLRDNKAIKVGL